MSLEELLTTLVIDSIEKRYVATFYIPGAYLHALMPEEDNVIMTLGGNFVDIICEVNKDYKKYITYEKGKKVLYLRVLRAIYGCIQSALLWFELFSHNLIGMGFIINSYDK